jgi:hypothetical protein
VYVANLITSFPVAVNSSPAGMNLRTFSSLEIRFQLVTPTDYEQLAEQFLPELSEPRA